MKYILSLIIIVAFATFAMSSNEDSNKVISTTNDAVAAKTVQFIPLKDPKGVSRKDGGELMEPGGPYFKLMPSN